MKTKLEVLYARPSFLEKTQGEPQFNQRTPVVRYADACAAIEKLEQRIAELEKQLERMALVSNFDAQQKLSDITREQVGRWDGPAKVL